MQCIKNSSYSTDWNIKLVEGIALNISFTMSSENSKCKKTWQNAFIRKLPRYLSHFIYSLHWERITVHGSAVLYVKNNSRKLNWTASDLSKQSKILQNFFRKFPAYVKSYGFEWYWKVNMQKLFHVLYLNCVKMIFRCFFKESQKSIWMGYFNISFCYVQNNCKTVNIINNHPSKWVHTNLKANINLWIQVFGQIE